MSELAVPVRAVRSPPLWTGNALRLHEGRLTAPLVQKNVRMLLMAFHDWNTLKILVNRRKRCMFFYEFGLLQQNASISHPSLGLSFSRSFFGDHWFSQYYDPDGFQGHWWQTSDVSGQWDYKHWPGKFSECSVRGRYQSPCWFHHFIFIELRADAVHWSLLHASRRPSRMEVEC